MRHAFSDSELRDHLGFDNMDCKDQMNTDKLPPPPDMTVVDPKAGPVKKPLSAWQDDINYDDPPDKSWNEFFQETTFHGVKYIFEKSSFRYRKVTWSVVVILAIALFAWQVGERVNTYYKYQTTVDVEVIYTQTIDFPAVTICNQNSFRQTVAVDMELYHFIDKLYESQNYSGLDYSQYSLDIHADDFAKRTAHQLEDFIDSCKWHGEQCDMSHDFTMTLTDIGVCYTFNGQGDPRQVTEPGAGSGLSLILNVEQYEYMRGPQNDAGVKILLHEQEEIPHMKDMGFAAAPGTHTLVGVKREEVISIPAPYGHCRPGGQPMSNCLTQCKTEYIMEMCHCRDVYMPDVGTSETNSAVNGTSQVFYPICDLTQKFKCVEHYIEKQIRRENTCNCPMACERVMFSPSLSYAHLSRFNVDRLVLTDPTKKEKVKKQFLQAKEVSQRTIVEIAEHDQELMNEIVGLGNTIKNILLITKPKMENFRFFARAHGFPDVINDGMQSIQNDFEKLMVSLEAFNDQMDQVLSWLMETHKMQDILRDFLDIQGNSSKMVNALRDCTQKGYSTGETSTVSLIFETTESKNQESDPAAGLSLECEQLFDQVQNTMYCLANGDRKPQDELQSLPNVYEALIMILYPNTSDSVPGHDACMESLHFISSTYAPIADEIFYIAYGSADDVKTINDMADAVQSLYEVSLQSDFLQNPHWSFQFSESAGQVGCKEYSDPESGYITNCNWVMGMASSFVSIYNKIYVTVQSHVSITTQQAMANAKTSFGDASKAIRSLNENINKKLSPALDLIENYIKVNATKQNLAEHFQSVTVQESVSELASITSRLDSDLQEFIDNIKLLDEFAVDVYRLFMETPVPLIHVGNIFDFNVYGDVKTMNSSYMIELQEASSDDFPNIATKLLEDVFEGYVLIASEMQANITPILQKLTIKLDTLKKEMISYGNQGEMNDQFYMDNFLQVDIFYATLSYQKVEQMPAFEISSLFGEIGGFLGLLLGASIITLCELLDYITILIVKSCHKKKAVDHNSDIKKKPLY